MELKLNGKYTLIEISSFMACSVRREITITREINGKYIFKLRGKRKEFYLKDFDDRMLFFEGWDLWLIPDTEFKFINGMKQFKGNALFNLVGEKDEVKKFIETFNLNSLTDKSLIIATGDLNNKEIVVYPELAEQTQHQHAVLKRIMEKTKEKNEVLN